MILAMSRKVFVRHLSYVNSCSNICMLSVRRNAFSISPLEDGLLLSDVSSISSLEMSKRESFRQKKTETIVALLRDYRFSDTLISKLETSVPGIFKYCPEKNLSVKLRFFESIGISVDDIPKFVMGSSYLLTSSLEKKLIPCYNYLKNLCVCEEQLIRMLMSYPRILTGNLEKTIAPNVDLLRGMGVPSCVITHCVTHDYLALSCSHEQFKSSVNQAIEIGLSPSTKTFVLAVRVLCSHSKHQWDLKMEVYRGFGLSDDQILLTFRNQPSIMDISEKKIVRGLEFFLKELGWPLTTLVSNPVLLLLSLERRVIPRYRLVDILRKRGLLNNDSPTARFFIIGEEQFIRKYIDSYKDDYPELVDIYARYKTSRGKTS